MNVSRYILLLIFFQVFQSNTIWAQPGFQIDIEKPKPYEERKLKAEKTGEGKLKAPRRILQNLTTRYNYFFNASAKFNEVIDRATAQHRDDYAQLLSFYPYDLNATAADSAQLDSVIYKARTGLVNHDLRNEWTDELYLLWSAAFHLQKKFDSASLMLQFINYAYAPKFEDGYYKHIGTNTDGAKELSIATKEEGKFLHSNTFSRNNAFLWQIRTLTEMENMAGAGSLIFTLKRDPVFPKRLQRGLDEVEAYWYFKQQRWDSAAAHLLAAVEGDYSRREKARWHYLAAQLMEKSGKAKEASDLYQQVVSMTPDPVMEVYARLNVVRLNEEGGEEAINLNLAELLKMARRDKYEDYRDIIYFMAAQMELQRGNIAAASDLLLKGAKNATGDQAIRNRAFLQIADVSYQQKKYLQAASFYDSVQVAALEPLDAGRVETRKAALQNVVLNSEVVSRQDSLQRIAALPQQERDAYVKSLVKKLRKAQGLKEDATVTGGSNLGNGSNTAPVDLFAAEQKGEWYFYNGAAKTQGAAQFKAVWGNRPNVDNWRRFGAVNQQMLAQSNKGMMSPDAVISTATGITTGTDLSFDGLLSRLPSTPEALQISNDSVRNALFGLGTAYLNEVEDYPLAIQTFEELRRRFPDADRMDEILFNLQYAYTKVGDAPATARTKSQLSAGFPSSRLTAIANTGKDSQASSQDLPAATKAYENVYNLFIEGQFAQAEAAKRIADSTYKTNFWQPQLLYIESVYYIRQRQDKTATEVLQTIIRQNTNQGLTEKAQNLINVLARRQQIEDELTRLQISRPEEDTVAARPVARQKPVAVVDSSLAKPVVQPKDSAVVAKEPAVDPTKELEALARARQKEIRDSIALDKVLTKRRLDSLETVKKDSLALVKKRLEEARKDSLAKKAIADKERRDSIAAAKIAFEQARRDSVELAQALRRQASDSLALQTYLAKRERDSLARVTRDSLALVKKQADERRQDSLARVALQRQQRQDSIALAEKQRREALALEVQKRADSIAMAKALREQARRDSISQREAYLKYQQDSIAEAKRNYVDPAVYHYEPAKQHASMIILDKVDPIFVNEARTAFTRYNRDAYPDISLEVTLLNLTADSRILLVSGFPTAAVAAEYTEKAKTLAPTEIIPWLTGNKYTFSIISSRNLQLLKTKGDVAEYKRFLEQHLPGKF